MDVRTLCLGVLTLGDASGYEIKKKLEDEFAHFYDASFGSIYPALSKLQTDGMVDCTYEAQSKRPDKKVYNLTSEGRLALVKELSDHPAPDRIRSEFVVMMLFARLLPAGHVSQVIDDRIAGFEKSVDKFRALCDGKNSGTSLFVSGYGVAIYETAMKYLQENRHLVEAEALLAQVQDNRITKSDAAD